MIRRAAEAQVRDALADTPVVLIHGPRQAGKSTLARAIADGSSAYRTVTLDDPIPRGLAVSDPTAFVASLGGPAILDEVQRAPGLFLAIKSSVDRDRAPGRFLLTGSANVLALPQIADSLAGRIEVVDLLPFAQVEIEGDTTNFVDAIFDASPRLGRWEVEAGLDERLVRGGFPEPSTRASAARRDAWFRAYLRTILERDVRDLANVEGLTQMPRVLGLLAARSGQPLNVIGLARDTGIPNTSLHRYLDLLRAVFLLRDVPAWSEDPKARLTRSPKAYLVDSGLLCHLANATPRTLARDPERRKIVLESFVAAELQKLASVGDVRPALFHLRTVRHLQVDFVLEARGGTLVGVQVKQGPTLRPEDADGLRFLRELAGERFARGVVLYEGDETLPMGPDLFAVPLQALWRPFG